MNLNGGFSALRAAGLAAGLALSVALAPTARAQGDANWQKIVAAAKKEGSLVIYYQAVPPVVERVVKDFMAMYPEIKVEAKRQVQPAQHMAVIENEKKSNLDGADISQYANAIWYRDKMAEGFFLKPAGPALEYYPKDYLLYGAVPVIAVMPFMMVYNTNLVKPPITGYRDFLRPELKGKISTSDLVAETAFAWYEFIEKSMGEDFLAKLAAQSPRLTPSVVPATQGVASGEMHAAMNTIYGITNPLITQGAPLKVVQPNPAFASQDVVAALAHSRRPNAALVFLDFMMSRRGQTAWNGRGETASPIPGIPGSLDAKTMQPWDPFRYTIEFQQAYRAKWNKLFKP
ncbi:MAG: extracellular solute-binding protein [Betaproteobacteria bacterium]|nr:extracellular solute-binding protein [Betaproteobacteria bacterium]